jgi:ABC-2 type transport system ATP-binding protein
MIHVKSLSKDYGSRRAVDGITFNAEKGEILGFLGPNGAAKPPPCACSPVTCRPPAARRRSAGSMWSKIHWKCANMVGYMPESVPLYNEMTVMEYLT